MRVLIICVAVVLSITTDVVCGKYQKISGGWILKHRVMASWDEAFDQCQREGAVLASPITPELRSEMQSMLAGLNSFYMTGVRARFNKLIFESVEGVLLDDMPVSDMFEQLNPDEGQCLAMSSNGIQVIPCTSRLPYMCYKKEISTGALTECGTYDQGYVYSKKTGNCYKAHYVWNRRYSDAYATCVAEGGYLSIVNDYYEAIFILQFVTRKDHQLIIGLVDWKGTNEWTSIRGEPVKNLYNVWQSGVTTNVTSGCGMLDPVYVKLNPLKNCLTEVFDVLSFVCEKNPSVVPYTATPNVYT